MADLLQRPRVVMVDDEVRPDVRDELTHEISIAFHDLPLIAETAVEKGGSGWVAEKLRRVGSAKRRGSRFAKPKS